MFTACENKGFSMIFDNGFEISVQWGTMNYCSRKGDGDFNESILNQRWKSLSAEIAIFDTNKSDEDVLDNQDMIEFANDTVKGWVSTNDVANIIFIVSLSSSFKDLQQVVNTNKW